MKTFTDNTGREWAIDLTIGAAKRLKSLLNVDLLNFARFQDTIGTLTTDRDVFCSALFCLVQAQANAKQIVEDAFWDSMNGDTLDAAIEAFVQELIAFFPLVQRPALVKAWEKINQVQAKAVKAMTAKLDSPAMDAQIDEMIERAGESSTGAPASSASTPTP